MASDAETARTRAVTALLGAGRVTPASRSVRAATPPWRISRRRPRGRGAGDASWPVWTHDPREDRGADGGLAPGWPRTPWRASAAVAARACPEDAGERAPGRRRRLGAALGLARRVRGPGPPPSWWARPRAGWCARRRGAPARDPLRRQRRAGGRRRADRDLPRRDAHARQPRAGDGPDPGHRRADARPDGPRHPRRAHPAALGGPARGAAARGRPRRRRGAGSRRPRVAAPCARSHLRDRRRRAARDARADRSSAPRPVRGPPPRRHPRGRDHGLRGARRLPRSTAEFVGEFPVNGVSITQRITLYRILQETLTNAQRHGRATR